MVIRLLQHKQMKLLHCFQGMGEIKKTKQNVFSCHWGKCSVALQGEGFKFFKLDKLELEVKIKRIGVLFQWTWKYPRCCLVLFQAWIDYALEILHVLFLELRSHQTYPQCISVMPTSLCHLIWFKAIRLKQYKSL